MIVFDLFIFSYKSAIVSTYHIPSLHNWDGSYKLLPSIREDVVGPFLVQPQHLLPVREYNIP